MVHLLAATINFSRLGARAFISKTAKTSAKVYFKSTVAGLHPDEQAAGQRLPALATAGSNAAAGAPPAATTAAAVSNMQQVPQAGLHATYSAGPSPYPPGPAAAASAVGAARVGAAPAYAPQ